MWLSNINYGNQLMLIKVFIKSEKNPGQKN
jgi:hypothetical protein